MRRGGLLSVDSVTDYLRGRGMLAPADVTRVSELSGGISNIVLRVEHSAGAVVVKQSLPRLRVAPEWNFDATRVLVEARCMRALQQILATDQVPRVLDVDEEALAFTMTCAPDGGAVWKDSLLAGEVDARVARRAGELLGDVHAGTAGQAQLAEDFGDLMPLLQGRIDPYHRTAARAHPDLADLIEADIGRLTGARRTLVLGDFSPKNLIVYPDHVLALDFEVAHWGDPAFDSGFMLTHLVAKAVHQPSLGASLLDAARSVWDGYTSHAGPSGAAEADTVAECAVLLLCRVDGKSRLEYLAEDAAETIRRLARRLIASTPPDVDGLLAETERCLNSPGALAGRRR